MEFIDFLGEILGITKDFTVTKIEKNEFDKTFNIHIEYLPKTYSKSGKLAIIAVCCKLLRQVFGCVKNRIPYDDNYGKVFA